MRYPIYVHAGDGKHSHGIIIPDFPGCFAAADSWQDLPQAIQEAVEVFCEGESGVIPYPTPIEELQEDPGYQGGSWMFVNIDISRLSPTMRVPEPLRQVASKPPVKQVGLPLGDTQEEIRQETETDGIK